MRTLVLVASASMALACAADKPAAPAPASAPAAPPASSGAARPGPGAGRAVEIEVGEAGFRPREVKARTGEPLTLIFTRVTDRTCITAIDIPDERVKGFQLPLGAPVSLTITPARPGVEAFHCSAMGMGGGKIVVE